MTMRLDTYRAALRVMTSANARNIGGARYTGYRRAHTCADDVPRRNDFAASNCAAPAARAIGAYRTNHTHY